MNVLSFRFPASLKRDRAGGLVVSFRDLPEAWTQGENRLEALAMASDCLAEAIAARIMAGEPIPEPSKPRKGESMVSLVPTLAAKAALHTAILATGTSRRRLGRLLGSDEKEVRRMLDPRHPTKLPRIDAALAVLGRRLILGVEAA